MIEPKSIDHITLCVENLDEAEFLFTKVLGFEVIWSARDVGTDKSSMDTVVVQCGAARIALMQGRDKAMKSQITDFIERYGQGVHMSRSKWMTSRPYVVSGKLTASNSVER